MAPLPNGSPLGLYIHIPFCGHICPYCDFNTYAGQDALIPRYVAAVERDIRSQGERLGHPEAATIFFGGGTPSLLSGDDVRVLIDACRDAFTVQSTAEVTLEANPNSADRDHFASIRDAGVNRLSLGVQTLHRRGLRVLGRQHEAKDAELAFRAARDAGFDNVNLDLIFGWPKQTIADWRRDLETILAWPDGPDHLSLYSLIVEPGTPMADAVGRGILTALDDDATADLYEAAIDLLTTAGWVHYEVANWARTEALRSNHNLIYWRNGEYAGFGAGAHARVGPARTMNHLLPKTYIETIERAETAASNREELTPEIAAGETMMLGLRLLQEGVSDAEFTVRHGCSLTSRYSQVLDKLDRDGLIVWTGERVTLTHRGLMLANDVCAQFL